MLDRGSHADIAKMFNDMRLDVSNLILSVIEAVYFMRGAIQYDAMMLLSPIERTLIKQFLSDRMDAEKDKLHPIY